MSIAVEKIIEFAKGLSPEELRELQKALDAIPPRPRQRPSVELIDSIKGKYAHIPFTTEDLAAARLEEIELENRIFSR